MKTKQAIKKYAYGLAQSHFYSDDEIPWEPFENYEEGWLQENVDDLGRAIERAMLWAQERGRVMNNLEREAFINAYLNNSGYAPRDAVEDILTKLGTGADIEHEHEEYYTNVTDMLGVWHEAVDFATKLRENK